MIPNYFASIAEESKEVSTRRSAFSKHEPISDRENLIIILDEKAIGLPGKKRNRNEAFSHGLTEENKPRMKNQNLISNLSFDKN